MEASNPCADPRHALPARYPFDLVDVWHTSDGVMDVLILGVPAGERTDVWFE